MGVGKEAYLRVGVLNDPGNEAAACARSHQTAAYCCPDSNHKLGSTKGQCDESDGHFKFFFGRTRVPFAVIHTFVLCFKGNYYAIKGDDVYTHPSGYDGGPHENTCTNLNISRENI